MLFFAKSSKSVAHSAVFALRLYILSGHRSSDQTVSRNES